MPRQYATVFARSAEQAPSQKAILFCSPLRWRESNLRERQKRTFDGASIADASEGDVGCPCAGVMPTTPPKRRLRAQGTASQDATGWVRHSAYPSRV